MAVIEYIKQISTLTNKDYIEIVSTFITLTQPRYRCFDCKNKYKNDKEKASKNFEAMACNYMATKARHGYKPDFNNKGNPAIEYFNCIGNHYYGQWSGIINYYPKWEKGILPFSGGYSEQPAKFVEIMDLVHNLIKENEQESERKQQLISRGRRGRR